MQLIDGHYFPDGIKETAPGHAFRLRDQAFAAMERHFPGHTSRRVAVTAGGMTGLWALEYLKHGFSHVVTFEPAVHVWECLVANCRDEMRAGLIEAHNVALGSQPGTAAIIENSLGASFLHSESPGRRITRVRPLDFFSVCRCDWLQLDLEGFEYQALLGAHRTIERFRPIIQLEERVFNGRYVWDQDDVDRIMRELRYVAVDKLPGADTLYKPL